MTVCTTLGGGPQKLARRDSLKVHLFHCQTMIVPTIRVPSSTHRAVGGDGGDDENDKEKEEEAERERQEAIREAEERRKEKHRKMEEEREKMRQEIRDKVSTMHQHLSLFVTVFFF
uniref:Complexin n=1 Tax=Anopheles culicifacies TaxID=139723 RepID=A0A182MLJ7_9DIPT